MKQLITLLAVLFSATVFAQNVGIGETTPTDTRLQVKRADSALLMLHNSSTGADVKTGMFFKSGNSYSGSIITTGNTASQSFRMGFSTFGSPSPSGLFERISINDIGNVGIGNTNPVTKLDINGQIKISGGSPAAGRILESDANGLATWVDKPGGSLPAGVIGNTIRHNGTSFIATSNLYNDGNRIGIGTTTPGSMLEIKPATGTADIELNASTGDNAVLRLNKNGASNFSVLRFKNSGVNTWDFGTQGDDNFKLKYVPTNFTVIDVDDATGNIGIATNDYTEKINVNGNVAAYGAFISKFSNAGFQFQDRSANAYGGWNWYADAGKANLYRYGSNVNMLTVDATGKMGIGISSPTSPLSFPAAIGKKISLYPGTTGDAGFGVFGNELRINSDNINADITFGYDSYAPAFFEKMRIKGNGNVGIGTNAPSNKLDVSGRMRLRNESAGVSAGIWIDGPTTAQRGFIGALDNDYMGFYGSGNTNWGLLYNENTGQVNIGTLTPATGYLLNVNGKIISEEVRVQLKAAWPDYVFEKSYKKLSLDQLEKFVDEHKHLPNIPSAKEIEKDGQHLGEIQRKMLEKIEELSLYVIELKKEIDALKKK